MNDQQIEDAFTSCGGQWDGSRWIIEDADLHPFARTLLAAAPQAAPAPQATFDLTEARAIVVDAIRRMRAGHVACHDLTMKAEDFLEATHAAAKGDELWDQTLRERDRYHEVADKLAQAIATYLGVSIGEHSSANCPWDEALEAIAGAPAPQALTEREPLTEEQMLSVRAVLTEAANNPGKPFTLPTDAVESLKAFCGVGSKGDK